MAYEDINTDEGFIGLAQWLYVVTDGWFWLLFALVVAVLLLFFMWRRYDGEDSIFASTFIYMVLIIIFYSMKAVSETALIVSIVLFALSVLGQTIFKN